jgi:hypothetical protein
MHKLVFTFITAISVLSVNAQNTILDRLDPTHSGSFGRNNVFNKAKENILGTPYLNDKFNYAEISGVEGGFMMRYDAASDQVEIRDEKDNDKVFILPKKDEFGSVNFKFNNYMLKLFNYTNDEKENQIGYLVELTTENGVSLLRRDKISLQEAKDAKNSYDKGSPPKYVKARDEYYLQLKDKSIIVFPKNKKTLQEAFPAKKEAIEAYIKTNKLSFKDEKDMAAITRFISTL